ncbi:MAG: GGDEF domain-containing protein [Gammaproteobacteria bacterium]|nr:GGDEF domain-containing protein [Gammaproteobacteria bacterium]
MVLNIPSVSKCIINSEQEIAALAQRISTNNITKSNLTQLSHILQLSLETDKILQLFFKQVKLTFKLSKLLYIHKDYDLSILLGNRATTVTTNVKNFKNIKSYELFYQKEYLGEINVISKIKLPPSKILELKSYVNLLILPLRNSLMYTKAIKETRIDALTQTGNRLALIEDLQYHFNLAARYNSQLSVLFIDIDYFKKINDQYGHIAGDRVLFTLGHTLKTIVRKSDLLYRFGGEEFVIILENTNKLGAVNLAKKIKQHFNKNKINALEITVSIGIATKTNSDNCESLMERADKALYTAKERGRNRFIVG